MFKLIVLADIYQAGAKPLPFQYGTTFQFEKNDAACASSENQTLFRYFDGNSVNSVIFS